MIVSAIAAVSENGIIGRGGDLPWHLPEDMKFFQRTTLGHPVIMGRKNWDSIPPKFRPLRDRVNIVISRNTGFQAAGAIVVTSLKAALEHARSLGAPEAFIIGGGQIFNEALSMDLVDRLYITTVHAKVDGDVYFPALGPEWRELWHEHHDADARHAHAYTFKTLERIPA